MKHNRNITPSTLQRSELCPGWIPILSGTNDNPGTSSSSSSSGMQNIFIEKNKKDKLHKKEGVTNTEMKHTETNRNITPSSLQRSELCPGWIPITSVTKNDPGTSSSSSSSSGASKGAIKKVNAKPKCPMVKGKGNVHSKTSAFKAKNKSTNQKPGLNKKMPDQDPGHMKSLDFETPATIPVDLQKIPFMQNNPKSSLAFFLPDECCPYCLRMHNLPNWEDFPICNCCKRSICPDCLKKNCLTSNVRMCPLCDERNHAKEVKAMIDAIWDDL